MSGLVRRLRSAAFAAEQNAIWNPDWPPLEQRKRTDPMPRQGPEDVMAFFVLAWLFYWAHPGTWRRIPSHFRAFVRVGLWWPLVRFVTGNPRYPRGKGTR